jgi:hypothetical protein
MATPYNGVQVLINVTLALQPYRAKGGLLTHAPQSPYLAYYQANNPASPGYYGSYQAVLAIVGPNAIDWLNIQFYNQNSAAQGDAGIVPILTKMPGPVSPVFGVGSRPCPQLAPAQLAVGQLAPPNPLVTAPSAITPALSTTLMYWIQNDGDASAAASDAARWSGVSRLVLYTNGALPSTLNVPECTDLVLGFLYPKPGSPFEFGFYIGALATSNPFVPNSTAFANALQSWKSAKPGRHVLVGLGGELDAPDYAQWVGQEASVAAGIEQFMTNFQQTNGWALDGIDIDFEDSNALDPKYWPSNSPGYPPAYPPAFPPAYPPARPPAAPPAYPPARPPAAPPAYPPARPPAARPVFPPARPPAARPVFPPARPPIDMYIPPSLTTDGIIAVSVLVGAIVIMLVTVLAVTL